MSKFKMSSFVVSLAETVRFPYKKFPYCPRYCSNCLGWEGVPYSFFCSVIFTSKCVGNPKWEITSCGCIQPGFHIQNNIGCKDKLNR